MKSPSEYASSRKALLLICLSVAAIITFEAIRIWVADYRIHMNRVDQMERGLSHRRFDLPGRIGANDEQSP